MVILPLHGKTTIKSRMSDKRDNSNNDETARKSALAYAAALALFFSVLIFFGIGWFLDKWLGTSPWFVVAGIILGAVFGFYEFFRLLSKLS